MRSCRTPLSWFTVVLAVGGLGGCITESDITRSAVESLNEGELAQRLSELEGKYETLQGELADLRAEVPEDLAGRLDTLEGHVGRAGDKGLRGRVGTLEDTVGTLDEAAQAAPEWIREDTTWTVDGVGNTPGAYASPTEAILAARQVRLFPQVVLTIAIDDGTYGSSEPMRLDHPDGAQIRLVGNTADPSQVRLFFAGGDGLVVGQARAFGWIDGVTLAGGDGPRDSVGLRVTAGAVMLGEQVVVTGFSGDGLHVAQGGLLSAPGITVSNNGRHGAYVAGGSQLEVPGATLQDNGGDGAHVIQHSVLLADQVEARGNAGGGVEVRTGSTASVHGAVFEGNGGSGLALALGAFASADESVSIDNDTTGFFASEFSGVRCVGCEASENQVFGYRSAAMSFINPARTVSSQNQVRDYDPGLGEVNAQNAYMDAH